MVQPSFSISLVAGGTQDCAGEAGAWSGLKLRGSSLQKNKGSCMGGPPCLFMWD